MGVRAGYGVQLGGGNNGGGGGTDVIGNLSANQIPRFNATTRRFENSGFQINAITSALEGTTNVETTGTVQSGVSALELGSAHAVLSTAENVVFSNLVTNDNFHPTWQTTERLGDWASVQRTPLGSLVEDQVFQADRSQTVTNPNFTFTSVAGNQRLYEINVEPVSSAQNVVFILEQRNTAGNFVDYWRSQPLNLTASDLNTPTPQNIINNSFIDLFGSTDYRVRTLATADVQLRGNAAGIPRITLTLRPWQDQAIVTQQDAVSSLNDLDDVLYPVPTNAASGRVQRLVTQQAERRIDLQVNVGDEFTNNELTGRYTIIGTNAIRGNSLVMFSANAITNLALKLTVTGPNQTPNPSIIYAPSRLAWDTGTGGLDFTPGGELPIPLPSHANHVFNVGDVIGLELKKSTGTIRGSGTNPAFVLVGQNSQFIALADVRDVPADVGDLLDVAQTRGTSGQVLAVNAAGTALEYITPAAGISGILVGDNGNFFPTPITRIDARGGIQFGLSGTDGILSISSDIGLLNDVPSNRGASGQILAVNAAGTALQYVNAPTATAAVTNWSHSELPSGQIPQRTHVWYRHTGTANITRQMPTTTNLPSGWHAFFANDTTNTTVTLQGNFYGDINQLVLREQEGCEISWNGTNFVEGANRDSLTTSTLADWQHNPLIPGNTYITRGGISFSAGANILNMEANGVTADMLNRRVQIEAPGAYRVDIPTLAAENRTEIPVNMGYGFTNNGGGILSITPRSVDEIAMNGTRYRGQSPMLLAFGASVTFTRTNDNLWTVTSSRGTITGGV